MSNRKILEIPEAVQEEPEVAQEVYKNIDCASCEHQFKAPEDEPCRYCACSLQEPEVVQEMPNEIKEEIQEDVPKGSAANSEHYMKQEIQSIEVMQMVMSYEKFLGFLEGNIIKYSMRCGLKDDPKQEKTKIKQYKMWLDMARVGQIIDPRVHVYKEDNKEDNKDE